MPHTRYKTLDEFRAIIEPFEHDDYYPANHRLPFVELLAASAIEVPYFNYAQFHQYAAILMECALAKGVDEEYVQLWIDHVYRTQILQDDLRNRVNLYIAKVKDDPETANQISILPLMCGAGKSTAISYLIKDILVQSDSDGILIVTDRTDRMLEYVTPNPERDAELHQFLQDHKQDITILQDGEDLQKAFAKSKNSPVLIMTTQRYFAMPKPEICNLLNWGNGKHRSLILFDEAPIMTEHISITRKMLNDIATLISERIPYNAEEQEEKQFCINHWELFRSLLYDVICRHEALHEESEYFTPYEFPRKEPTDDDARFLRFIHKHRANLRIGKEDNAQHIASLFRLLTEKCVCYAGRSGNWYSNSISAVVDNREKLTDLDAKVIILDGTGEINPDYDPSKDDIRTGRTFNRIMNNLTIHFINTRGISRDTMSDEEEAGFVAAAAAKYIKAQHPDMPIAAFTYKDAAKHIKDHFDAVEYFGNLKGKNEFREYECIAQIGLHRFPGVFYGAQTLYHHPEMFDVAADASPDELLAWSNRLIESEDMAQLRDLFMLIDLEQNLFRSAIRMPDCITPVHYYVFCNTRSNQTLIQATRERFEREDNRAHVEVLDDPGVLATMIDAERPDGKPSVASRIRYQISQLPPRTRFTTRDDFIKGIVAVKILPLADVNKQQFNKAKGKNKAFKNYMDSMKTETEGYYVTPMR